MQIGLYAFLKIQLQKEDFSQLQYPWRKNTVGEIRKEDCNLLIYTAFGVYIIPAFIAFLLWFLIRHVTEKLIHCPRHDVRDEKKAMPRPNDLQNILVKNAAIDTGLFLTYFRFNSIHIYDMGHIIWYILYEAYDILHIIFDMHEL